MPITDPADLRGALQESRPSGPIARLRRKDRLDRTALARDLERVAERYRRAGYKDAAVGEPEIDLSPTERVSDRTRHLVVGTLAGPHPMGF